MGAGGLADRRYFWALIYKQLSQIQKTSEVLETSEVFFFGKLAPMLCVGAKNWTLSVQKVCQRGALTQVRPKTSEVFFFII